MVFFEGLKIYESLFFLQGHKCNPSNAIMLREYCVFFFELTLFGNARISLTDLLYFPYYPNGLKK